MTCDGLRLKTILPWLAFTRPTHFANVTPGILRRALAWLEGDLSFYPGGIILRLHAQTVYVVYPTEVVFERPARRVAAVPYVSIRTLLRSEFQMKSGKFIGLHASCTVAMRAYFVEAERTSAMLAKCAAKPK